MNSSESSNVDNQDISEHVRVLRQSFQTNATKDVAMRKHMLRQLQTLLQKGEQQLLDALWKDLHKHPTESFIMEIGIVLGEIQLHLDYLDEWAKLESVSTDLVNLPGRSYIQREPLGVVCIIGTWNYPVHLTLLPLVAALSAGNCILLRLPSEDTTIHVNNVLTTLLDKHMDNRYVRCVYGGVDETKAMLREKFDLIFATGGTFLGKLVAQAAAETLTPTVLELGGKSPAIVDCTADIALAAKRLAWGAFLNGGQTCVRPDYVLVDAKIGDALVKNIESCIRESFGQDAQQSDSYGRIVNKRSFDRLFCLLEADRPHITYGGKSDAKDRFIEPTIFNFKHNFQAFKESAVMSEEVFGPFLVVCYYDTGNLSAAIDFIVNRREKPLALYHFSTDVKNKNRIARETSSGGLVFNDCMMQLANPSLPFGGVGTSGMGAYHGRFGFEAFSHRRAILCKYNVLDIPARYQPYSPSSERVLRLAMYPISRIQMRVIISTSIAIVVMLLACMLA